MAITNELRNSMTYDITTAPGGVNTASIGIAEFVNLCDTIDSIHAALLEAANERLRDRDGWVELPKDADGEYIHIGDKVTLYGRGVYEVDAIHFRKNDVSVSYMGESGCGCDSAKNFHHYHAPTVEDVLWEFAGECESARMLGHVDLPQEIFERYAKRLTLAGDAE